MDDPSWHDRCLLSSRDRAVISKHSVLPELKEWLYMVRHHPNEDLPVEVQWLYQSVELLETLQKSRTAKLLMSRFGRSCFADDIYNVRWANDGIDQSLIEDCASCVDKIVDENAPEDTLWSKVVYAVESILPELYCMGSSPSLSDASSESSDMIPLPDAPAESSDTILDMDLSVTTTGNRMPPPYYAPEEIFQAYRGRIYRGVDNFHDHFFQHMPWRKTIYRLCEVNKRRYDKDRGKWMDFPLPKFPGDSHPPTIEMQHFIHNIMHIDKYKNTYRFNRMRNMFQGDESDIGVAPYGEEGCWRVIGQFRDPTESEGDAILRLFDAAEMLFQDRPSQLFLHGIIISGELVECWVFDRAGAFSSGWFNLNADPDRFIKVLFSYIMMSDARSGRTMSRRIYGMSLNPENFHVTLPVPGDKENTQRFLLSEGEMATVLKSIPSSGSDCLGVTLEGTSTQEAMIKYYWSPDGTAQDQAKTMLRANQQGVPGIPKLLGYNDYVCNTQNWRRGLNFPMLPTHVDQFNEEGVLNRMSELHPNEVNEHPTAFLRVMAISTAGVQIEFFQSLMELACAFRDIIHGHRTLFSELGLLNRHICPGNMKLTDEVGPEGTRRGVLLNLSAVGDRPVDRDMDRRLEEGDVKCMAVGALRLETPTYAQDMESFLYSLIVLCIEQGPQLVGRGPAPDKIRSIDYSLNPMHHPPDASAHRRANIKERYTKTEESFRTTLKFFPPELWRLALLCEELRGALFNKPRDSPDTAEGTQCIYDDFAAAFDRCIVDLGNPRR